MPDGLGWESVAEWFIKYSARSDVGVPTVEGWVQELPPGAVVLDVGCGAGSPRSAVLMEGGIQVYAVDASPTLARAYKAKFPKTHVVCESVESSSFFGLRFDGLLAWGLVFLLPEDDQRRLLHRLVAALKPGGTLLFTAPRKEYTWRDATTGQPSLGADRYRTMLSGLGAPVVAEFEDEGQNHYYNARKIQGLDLPTRSNKSLQPTAPSGPGG